jgi:regulator of protease activity HflC (stomatin/prohibitin superfamily)
MDHALGWLGDIVRGLLTLVPRLVIVRSTHEGVRFKMGHKAIRMRPGIHWYWPLTTEISVVPTKLQPCNLQAQRIVTKDGITVVVGGVVQYEIEDVVSAVTKCWCHDTMIKDVAMAAIAAVIPRHNYEEFRTSRRKVNMALTKQLRRDLDGFGVRVRWVRLSDLAPCWVFSNVQ